MEELMKETKAGQTVPTSETEPKKKFGLPKSKKAKKWMKIAIAAVVIAAVAARLHGQGIQKGKRLSRRQLSGGSGHPAGSDAVRLLERRP